MLVYVPTVCSESVPKVCLGCFEAQVTSIDVEGSMTISAPKQQVAITTLILDGALIHFSVWEI